jgi:hypothetical protein
MEKKLKTFEVIQIIPSNTFVTYHVEAEDAEDAEFLVDNMDSSAVRVGEYSQDCSWSTIEYDVNEISEDESEI